MLCGRFEGVDQRLVEARGFEEVCVGDAVLAGGEAAAMVAIEACARLLPGVLGEAASLEEESFEGGLLEHPQYTRPREFEGRSIPEVLLSGDHQAVADWRRARAGRDDAGAPPGPLGGPSRQPTGKGRLKPAKWSVQDMNFIETLEKEEAERLLAGKIDSRFPPRRHGARATSRSRKASASGCRPTKASASAARGGGMQETFTVRKISFGEGVERVFPVLSPMIEFDRGQASRRGAARQALLSARSPREIGAHRRARRRKAESKAEPAEAGGSES